MLLALNHHLKPVMSHFRHIIKHSIIFVEEVQGESDSFRPNKKDQVNWSVSFGAGTGTLTLDLFLGKEAL